MSADEIATYLKNNMGADDMQPTQRAICAPKVQRNMMLLSQGSAAPPIQVANNMIIEGHHRYVAGKIYGQLPDIAPGIAISATVVTRWRDIHVDAADWDIPHA